MENKRIVYPKISLRFLGICIDFIIFGVLFFISSTFIFKYIFNSYDEDQIVAKAQVYSGLLIKDKNGYYNQLNSSDYIKYQEVVENYYLTDKYFGSSFYKENGGERSCYKVEEYNEKILQLGTDYTYFEYQYDENGKIDTSKIGVIKAKYYEDEDKTKDLTDDAKADLLTFYSRHYREIFSDLYNDSFYEIARNSIVQKGVYRIFFSAFIPYFLVFVIPPVTNKYGFTLGRFLTKVALVSKDGLYQKRYFFLIRNVPMVTLLIVILFEDNIFILAPIYGGYFLFNWLATLMNRENASLLDLLSFSRVANKKESIIYNNFEELEADKINGED